MNRSVAAVSAVVLGLVLGLVLVLALVGFESPSERETELSVSSDLDTSQSPNSPSSLEVESENLTADGHT